MTTMTPGRARGLEEARAYYAEATTPEEHTRLANEWLAANNTGRLHQGHHDLLRERELKRCHRCATVKLTGEFNLRKGQPQSECRCCQNARAFARLDADRDAARAESRASSAAYRKRHPWAVKLGEGRRRAIKQGAPCAQISEAELLEYWASRGIDPNFSYYSGVPLTSMNRSLDHFDPLNRPGTMGHTIENLFPCTIEENTHRKRGQHPLKGIIDILEGRC